MDRKIQRSMFGQLIGHCRRLKFDGGGGRVASSPEPPTRPVTATIPVGANATDVAIDRLVSQERPSTKIRKHESSTSSKQEAGGTVQSKKENFTGIVATTNGDKIRKKLHDIDTFVKHVKQRHLGHPALTTRPSTDPARITPLDIRRHDRLGGVLKEYRHAA